MSFMYKKPLSNDYQHVITKRANGSRRVQFISDAPSSTDQSFKNDCDINSMVKRFIKAQFGAGPNAKKMFEQWLMSTSNGQVDENIAIDHRIDYQDAIQHIQRADALFMDMPSDIRKRFNNDPGAFLNFAMDPKNRAELATMGLLTPEATERLKSASNAVKRDSEVKTEDKKSNSDQSAT